ncbi:MAG: hypothetical protein CMJ40_00220 [Phycisphaerae bacterium]|nr:hypothetical protein [Phycisphaerae bacterium]
MGVFSLLIMVSTCRAVEAVDQNLSSTENPSLMFDLNFPGGSLSELTDLISAKDPGYKFILKGDVGESPMPPLDIERIDVDACLWLIDSIMADLDGSRYELWSWHRRVRDGSDIVVFGRVLKRASRARSAIRDESSRPSDGEEPVIEIYSIAHLLDRGLTAEMILADLKNIELVNGQPLGFESALIDDETNLLFIKGKPSIQRLVASLMDALDESVRFIRHADKTERQPAPLGDEVGVVDELDRLLEVRIEEFDMQQLRGHIQDLARLRRQHADHADMAEAINSRFKSAMHALHQKVHAMD